MSEGPHGIPLTYHSMKPHEDSSSFMLHRYNSIHWGFLRGWVLFVLFACLVFFFSSKSCCIIAVDVSVFVGDTLGSNSLNKKRRGVGGKKKKIK